MTPSDPSASALTELILAFWSSSVLTERESLTTPRLVATTFSSVPFLKSSWLVCVQVLVLTAKAVVATKVAARNVKRFMTAPLQCKYPQMNRDEHGCNEWLVLSVPISVHLWR